MGYITAEAGQGTALPYLRYDLQFIRIWMPIGKLRHQIHVYMVCSERIPNPSDVGNLSRIHSVFKRPWLLMLDDTVGYFLQYL